LDSQIKSIITKFIVEIPGGNDQAASNALDDLKDQYDIFNESV
jgi:hypothetical protein